MQLAPALLEKWMREYYFDTEIDIGSSGVRNFSLAEVRQLTGLLSEDLDTIVFQDSQTLGGRGLRRAVADRWARGKVERVMATHGSTDANFMIAHALLSPGDEVVVLDPSYQQLYGVAEAIGCHLKRWPLRPERGFRPDLADARQVIGPGTRLVVVNFPHNPTGAFLTEGEQDELIRLVEAAGAFLIWDDAFGDLTYDTPPLPSPANKSDRAISMGTLSKAYGLPGLRVGWCLAAEEVLERFVRIRDYTTLHLSPLVERVAEKVIEKGDALLLPRLEEARGNLALLEAWAGDHADRIGWVRPGGGVSAFIRFLDIPDVEAFCHRLAREHKVLLVPGNCFRCPEYARLGFGCATAELEEGLARLSRLLAATTGGGVAVASTKKGEE
jgi:capreomycidine synthase